MAGLMTKFLPNGYFDLLLLHYSESMMNRLMEKDPELDGKFDDYGGGALCLKWFGTLFVNRLS